MFSVRFFVSFLVQIFTFSAAAALEGKISDEVRLSRRLLKDYVTSSRPVRTDDTHINVTLDIAFNQLLDIDEKAQVMSAAIWLRIGWEDEYLTWNETKEGVKSIVLFPSDIWIPDITLINNAHDEVNAIPVDKRLIVNSSGYINWLQTAVTKSQCTLNSLYFPFDVQVCPLIFGSWAYNALQVDLFSKNPTGDATEFDANGAWSLKDFPAKRESRLYQCCPETYTTITYYVALERQSLYFVFHLYLPCIMITFATLVVFYLPCESGEKTSFAVTMLLALTVFMLVASEYLPPSSSHVPIISQYFNATIMLLSLSLGATVLTLHVHHRGDYGAPPPAWLRRLTLTHLARPLCLFKFTSGPQARQKKHNSITDVDEESEVRVPMVRKLLKDSNQNGQKETCRCRRFSQSEGDNDVTCRCKRPDSYGLLDEIKQYLVDSDKASAIKTEYSKIAAVLDRAFFVLFFTVAVILNVYTFARYFIKRECYDMQIPLA